MKTTFIRFNTIEYAAALSGAASAGVSTVEEYLKQLMRKHAKEIANGQR